MAGGYAVPTYEAPSGLAWYHFLHGNVPGHQIDFMYRPEVGAGPLTRQHFSHLSRLVRYIEPRSRSAHAFAIGNLSRDDTQYEPGHGAVALIFGLRIRGAKDHAGRQDPPFCHAVAAVDRHFDEANLLEASLSFYKKLLPDEESQAEGSGWYHTYVRHAENEDALLPLLRAYVADFEDLPAPGPSELGLRWTVGEAAPPRRVLIVHGERDPFSVIAACAARIAAVLVASDIRWTAISSGREIDIPGGVSVRFVPEQDAGAEEEGVRVLRREEVPEDPEEIAAQLFGARAARGSRRQAPWREWRQVDGEPASEAGVLKRTRARTHPGVFWGLGGALLLGGAAAAVVGMGTKGAGGPERAQMAPTAAATAAAATTTEAVSASPPAEVPAAAPAAPVQKLAEAAPIGERKTFERPAGTAKKKGGEKHSVYEFDVPPELKK